MAVSQSIVARLGRFPRSGQAWGDSAPRLMKKKSDRIGTGPFAGSKQQFWKKPRVEAEADLRFQPYQFERSMGKLKSFDETLSGAAMGLLYGDQSLGRHVEQLIEGIHEALTKPAQTGTVVEVETGSSE